MFSVVPCMVTLFWINTPLCSTITLAGERRGGTDELHPDWYGWIWPAFGHPAASGPGCYAACGHGCPAAWRDAGARACSHSRGLPAARLIRLEFMLVTSQVVQLRYYLLLSMMTQCTVGRTMILVLLVQAVYLILLLTATNQ